jgi:predicted TIM-barrel fold metal-dependent hydrolase
MTGPIDVQTHWLPSAFVEALEGRSEMPRIVDGPHGRLVEYGEGAAYPLVPEMTDLERKLEHMDAGGVGVSVLSINIPGLDMFDSADVASLARDVNDQLADAVAAYPDRFEAFAALPMPAPDAVPEELERALANGLRGAMIYSNVAGRSLDEPEFRQVFEAAARLDAPVLLHPTYPLSASTLDAHALIPVLGFLFDTTTATMRLILDGLFDRHPDLKLILGHLGSVIPYLVGRIDYESSRIPGGLGALEVSPAEHIRRLHVDTVSAWPPAMAMAIEYLGADRVLYATDHPFWDPARTRDALAAVELSDVDREAIESGNARRLLRIDAESKPSSARTEPSSEPEGAT